MTEAELVIVRQREENKTKIFVSLDKNEIFLKKTTLKCRKISTNKVLSEGEASCIDSLLEGGGEIRQPLFELWMSLPERYIPVRRDIESLHYGWAGVRSGTKFKTQSSGALKLG